MGLGWRLATDFAVRNTGVTAVKDGFNVGTHRDVGSKEGDSSTTLVSKKRISSKYPKLAFKNPKVMKSSGREDGDLPKTEQQVNFSLVS